MRNEWKNESLRNVISYISKGIPPVYADFESDTTVCVLNQKCNRNYSIDYSDARLHDFSKRAVPQEKYLRNEDILINSTGTGTAGRIAQIGVLPFPSIIDGHMIVIRPNEKVLARYLGYSLKSKQAAILQLDEGSTGQTELNRERLLSEILVTYPVKTSTQCVIAATLSCLDDKIALNNRINQNLEAQAQAIFKSWFVDFEPWGGVMPAEWREGMLEELANITSGKRPMLRQTTRTIETNIPIIGASSIMGYTDSTLYNEKMLITGRVGTHGIIQRYSRPCWASDNTLVIKSKYYEFMYQQLCCVDFHNMNRGSTQPLITQTDLNNSPIIIPTEKALDDFEGTVGVLMQCVEDNIRENETLATLRDALLPKLMSGEINVDNRRDDEGVVPYGDMCG